MLSKEENERLARVGPGTPMGEYIRRFWLPVMLAEELPEPDGAPKRLRILGEDLVAFKDTNGQIGVLGARCPHRLAELFFGRNEECGLRCVYHGWKFDTTGACVDMPSEPAESNFKSKVRQTAYPAKEWGGLIWAYMGPADAMPELPLLEWSTVPDSHRFFSKRQQQSNWAQAVEGGIDSSHVSFLHSRLPGARASSPGGARAVQQAGLMANDTHPHFNVVRTDYGMVVGARRTTADDRYYWRITQFLLPFWQMIPGGMEDGLNITGHAWVPIDDENCWVYSFTWNGSRPITAEEIAQMQSGNGVHAETDANYRALRNKDNEYQIDRHEQRTLTYTGIKGIGEQDMAMQESMGAIVDRSDEHLGTSDTAIIAFRRSVLDGARELEQGVEPYAAAHGAVYRVRSASLILDRDVPFQDGAKERLLARS